MSEAHEFDKRSGAYTDGDPVVVNALDHPLPAADHDKLYTEAHQPRPLPRFTIDAALLYRRAAIALAALLPTFMSTSYHYALPSSLLPIFTSPSCGIAPQAAYLSYFLRLDQASPNSAFLKIPVAYTPTTSNTASSSGDSPDMKRRRTILSTYFYNCFRLVQQSIASIARL